jgi:hypothetical protein
VISKHLSDASQEARDVLDAFWEKVMTIQVIEGRYYVRRDGVMQGKARRSNFFEEFREATTEEIAAHLGTTPEALPDKALTAENPDLTTTSAPLIKESGQ